MKGNRCWLAAGLVCCAAGAIAEVGTARATGVDAVSSPLVRIESGRLRGAAVVDGVESYKGIPYAAAPLGSLRWRPPQKAPAWHDVRLAADFGARCMQQSLFGDMVFRASGMSEDCLFLNVWRPHVRSGAPLPVLVYFYGGGFVAGDGSEPRYDGASLAGHGLVVVTVNYRLGLFGFLAHPELSAESPQHASGNYGLLDQSAALHWVERNIRAFGGDPRRITIGGESAGSFSVSAQMASPLSRSLLKGAIGESGSVLGIGRVQSLAQAEAAGSKLAALAGAPNLAALRALSAEQVLALGARPEAGWPSPVVDGYFFPKSPVEIYAAGEQARIPLLAGFNSPEVPEAFLMHEQAPTAANFRAKVQELYGPHAGEVLRWYPADDDATAKHSARELASDRFIVQGTWKWVAEVARVDPEHTYYYRFDKPRPASRAGDLPAGEGAVHSGEIEYALGNLEGNKVYAWSDDDRQVSHTMAGYFAQFIKTGNPNGGALPYWPVYAQGKVMVIDVRSRGEDLQTLARHQAMDGIPSTQ